MRPIVIIKETNKEGKFELTEQELKVLIEQAYEQGFEDGKAQYNKPNWSYRNLNGIPIVNGTPTAGNFTSGEPDTAWNLRNTAVSTGV